MTNVHYALENSKRLILSFHKYQKDERSYIDNTIKLFLKDSGLEHISYQVAYCIHELVMNACKANMKRVYFDNEGLLIHDSAHYSFGMENFREQAIPRVSYYNKIKKQKNIHVEFQIKKEMDRLNISIINSFPLTKQEKERISSKFSAAERYNDVTEALSEIEDPTEGAGLGIVTMMVMLKEIGIPRDTLKIFSYKGKTHATISMPLVS